MRETGALQRTAWLDTSGWKIMNREQLQELNNLLSLAAEETSTAILRQLLEVMKSSAPSDNGGLEELGYVVAEKLIERGAL
jgi:hypothetical protein